MLEKRKFKVVLVNQRSGAAHTYLILPAVFKIFTFSACAISDKEVPMKKEKHSDISSRKKSNQKIIDSYDYLSNAASAQDCTGLIPVGPTNRAELESYEEVYHYQPPKIDPEKCE